ncbi:MAG: Stp1/IreP family PP2C-type Ser/Thr phosphatase [Anaerolineales bacterium]
MKPGSSSPILAAGLSHPGLNRPNNEDRYAILPGSFENQPALLAILADGIGGHQAGEVAAEIAVQTIRETIQNAQGGAPREILTQAFVRANQRINQAASENENRHGMGTTCVTAWVVANRLYTASLGDSRIYLWRNGVLRQVTTDHTWVQEAIESGVMTREQGRHHPNARIVRRYLGAPQDTPPDFRQNLSGLTAPNTELLLEPGDCILLCSDGLSDLVEDAEIAAILQTGGNLKNILERLIQRANEMGGRDNITAVLLAVPSASTPTVPQTSRQRRNLLLACGIAALSLCIITMLVVVVASLISLWR